MTKSIYSLPVHFSIKDEISNEDTRFLRCSIDVLHTGLNLNGSVFTKEVVEENINTIKNTPILGFVREVSDGEYDFAGHEYIITKDENCIRRKNIGSVWGVIPESCNYRWYPKTLDTGEEVEMLQVDALLWSKMEEAIDIMTRDIEKGQSMELSPDSISGYENAEGNFVFTSFSFDGCTILGRDICPAMQDANITIYSKNEVQFSLKDFVRNVKTELNDKLNLFEKISNETNSFTELLVNEKNNQGGIKTMPNTNLKAQFENISAMVRQHESFTNKLGEECSRYEVVDIRDNEVIVVDKMNDYGCFGLSFTEDNGGKTEIDFENAKKKKMCFEDCTENDAILENAFDFGKHISEITETAFAKVEEANIKVSEYELKVTEAETKITEFETAKNEIEEKFNQINAEFEEMKPKYEDFVKAEQARIDAELEAQKDAEFSKYETVLGDDVNFAALKEKKAEMSVKEIESECAILFARKNLANANFSKTKEDGMMTAGIIDGGSKDGFVETKYGFIPVRR